MPIELIRQLLTILQFNWHYFNMGTKPRNDVGPLGKAVAEILENIRQQRGISQREIEEATKISQSQISKMFRGIRAINLDELESICTSLSTSIEDVISLAEQSLQKPSVIDFDSRREAKAVTPAWEERYVADSSPEELFPGDDGYGEGP